MNVEKELKIFIISTVMGTVMGIVVSVFIVACISINIIRREIKEQNVILKELVTACQSQADAIQEQNKILNYNPMEEGK